MQKAHALAGTLGIDTELKQERKKKVPKRLDGGDVGVHLHPEDHLRVDLYTNVIDNISGQVTQRFPDQLTDFAYLQPLNMQAIDGERMVRQLAERYQLHHVDPDRAVSQWRLFRHLLVDDFRTSTSLPETYSKVPKDFVDLRVLYRVAMTLPVTTAGVERSFSKLCNLKTKLRSAMSQDRLEALVLAAVEKDLLMQLSVDDLVSKFAACCDRRLDLG